MIINDYFYKTSDSKIVNKIYILKNKYKIKVSL